MAVRTLLLSFIDLTALARDENHESHSSARAGSLHRYPD